MSRVISVPADLRLRLADHGIEPTDLVLYINSACNLRCRHCYVGDNLLSSATRYSADSLIAFLTSFSFLDRVTVLGGEPFLHPQFDRILDALSQGPVREKRITTNLMFLREKHIEVLNRSGVRVSASLDGHTAAIHETIRGSSTFARTLYNIIRLRDAECDLEVTHTVTALSLSHLASFLEFCKEIGLRRVNLHRISPRGNAIENDDLAVGPSEWVEAIREIETLAVPKKQGSLQVRYEPCFATEKEYEEMVAAGMYHHHAAGSFYSDGGGHRIVLYPDGKLYISSEAFGTEAHIGVIGQGTFIYNPDQTNELELYSTHGTDFILTKINPRVTGDANYPVPLSVSFRRQLFL